VEKYIPAFAKEIALLSLGVLGYGNHFIELQAVEDIIDPATAKLFGITKGQLCFMMHGDSRGFGQSLIDHYSKRSRKMLGLQQLYKSMHYKILAQDGTPDMVREILDKTNFYLNRFKSTFYWKMDKAIKKENAVFRAIDPSTEEGRAYLLSTYCAIDFGYANRAYMAAVINDALKEVFGDRSRNVRILHDGNHDALQEETMGGAKFFVHRNGAARALPRHYYKKHQVFSQTGQPVLLPSALGRPSYLCAAKDGAKDAYYSSCHGTGRQVDRGEARQMFKENDVFDEAKKINMKIYDYGKGKVSEEAPAAFKDVNKILDTIKKYGMAQPVVRLRPLADLKGWR
jgi:tRNA-splicing ligase RtcB